jgi:hypothetical protein
MLPITTDPQPAMGGPARARALAGLARSHSITSLARALFDIKPLASADRLANMVGIDARTRKHYRICRVEWEMSRDEARRSAAIYQTFTDVLS